MWRFRIRGLGLHYSKNSDCHSQVCFVGFWLVLAALGGEETERDLRTRWVQHRVHLSPFFFAPTCSKHIWSRARPFEAGGGRMGDSNRVIRVGKAKATIPHFSHCLKKRRSVVSHEAIARFGEPKGPA